MSQRHLAYRCRQAMKIAGYIFLLSTFLLVQSMPRTGALSPEQQKVFKLGINYFDVCGGASDSSSNSDSAATNAGSKPGQYKYIKKGSIPTGGTQVGASLFGGSYHDGSWYISNTHQLNLISQGKKKASDYNAKLGHGGDDNGEGNGGGSPDGHAAYAELEGGSALGNLPEHTKLEITYKSKTVIAERLDIGAGGDSIKGKRRAIDLWWETARLLDFKDGTDVVTLHVVPDDTPTTPVNGQASAAAPASDTGKTSCCPTGGGASDFGTGSLPSSVPKPYNAIFTAAAKKANISPALVAAIFYGGEHGNSFPQPPPPYGHGGPWASSSAGANGPFQFIPGTWASYGVDGNGDGKKDVQDLVDGAFGAANYLAASGAKLPKADLQRAIFAYNHVQWYVDNVMAAYKKFGGASSTPGGGGSSSGSSVSAETGGKDCTGAGGPPGEYKNPFRDVHNLKPLRIDQGVDYFGDGPVYALGNGTVTVADKTNSGWPGPTCPNGGCGAFTAYKLKDGPAQGKFVFVGENCVPLVKVNDQVTTSTVICNMHSNDPWIETGWAKGSGDVAIAWPCYEKGGQGSTNTAYGINFSQLMKKLGAPAGVMQSSGTTCTLPSDWPKW